MAFARGDFQDWSLLGEGGEAEVFRARQTRLDRLVAVKRLKLPPVGKDAEVRRFEREAKLCASLSHPSLVQIFDYGQDGKFYYLVMEYVEGVDLAKLIRPASSPLPFSYKVHLARQMAEAVEYIHRHDVLHGDIKPENYMVDRLGRVKMLDLGLARKPGPRTDHEKAMSRILTPNEAAGKGSGAPVGTLAYMAPERLQKGTPDKVSEFFSLAMVLLELFADRRIQEGRSAGALLELIQTGIRPEDMPGVPENVSALLEPYLAPDPGRRPSSLDDLLQGFKGMQEGTLHIDPGEGPLLAVIRRERKAWLWTLVRGLERDGRHEEAFANLRELLEADPDDAEARVKLQELGALVNQAPDRKGRAGRGRLAVGGTLAALLAASLALLYDEYRPRGDFGSDLAEREMKALARDGDVAAAAGATPGVRPRSRPYGVLIVTGLPKEFAVKVKGVRYRAGEIHLPATRHLLEILDAGGRRVASDSVTVGAGEPTVYEFAGRAKQP